MDITLASIYVVVENLWTTISYFFFEKKLPLKKIMRNDKSIPKISSKVPSYPNLANV